MTETQRVENVARDKQQLVLFSAFAYGLAWTCFGLLGLSRSGLGWLPYDLSIPLMIVAGSFAPSLAALVTLRITERRWPSLNGLTLQSAVVAAIATPLLIGTTFAVIPAIILTTGPWSALQWGSLLSVSVYSVSTIIGGPLGEEPGWRGFALPRFQRLLGPASGSIALGVLWAAWHLPLFWTKAWTSSTFPSYVLMVTGLSLSMTFLFNASGGSVVTAIAAHAFFNTVSRWLGGLLTGADLRSSPTPEVAIGMAGWGVGLLLLAASKGQLGYNKRRAV